MPQLAFEKRFFKGGDYDALPVHVRKNVREAMDKFPKLTPAQLKADKGLNFKPPAGARNRTSARSRWTTSTGAWCSPRRAAAPCCC